VENADVDSVIVFVAQYLLFIMAGGFAVYWLAGERWPDGKVRLGATAVVGLVLTLAFIYIGGKLHSDPRPFVQNPSLKPMFPHPKDNGFPSDHSAAAGLIAALVLWRNRAWGALFGVAALLVAAARVLSHVHHVQDVVAGLAFGVIAFLIAWYVVRFALAGLARKQARIRLPLIGDLDLAEFGRADPNGRPTRNGRPARPQPGRHADATKGPGRRAS
jgi:membrane-associated phospholipid phosphatase